MNLKKSVFAVLASLTLIAPAMASEVAREPRPDTSESTFTRAVVDVERAFYRRQSYVDPSTGLRDPAPTSLSALADYGFLPSNSAYTLSLTAVDATHSKVCIQMEVTSELLWRAATRLLSTAGVSRADAQCNAVSASPILAKWPTRLYAIKVLDTEDAMARTIVPSAPVVTGISSSPYVLPAATLPALPGQMSDPISFNITNPALPAPVGQPAAPTVTISNAFVRQGFYVEHNCVQVPAQHSCTVTVRYQGNSNQAFKVGNLRLEFSDGNFATVGLLGKRGKGSPYLTSYTTSSSGTTTSGSTTTTSGTTTSGSTTTSGTTTSGSTGTTTTATCGTATTKSCPKGNAYGRLRRGF